MNASAVSLFAIAVALCACSEDDFKKPKYLTNPRPTLYTTISSDGKLIAALDQIGAEKPRLRFKWLDKDESWQELPAPMFTDSIRFGLSGYGLLMTHAVPGQAPSAQLTRWDVSALQKQSETLYTGPNLAFPIEAQPGRFMVRICTPNDGKPDRCGLDWLLVSTDGTAVQVSPKNKSLRYSQPNITPEGFFWFDEFAKTEGQPDLRAVLAYPWPSKSKPNIDVSMLDKSTANIRCDYQATRCLHRFTAAKNPVNGRFIYDIEIFEGKQRCRPKGLTGWSDGQSVSPDGRAAVMSLAVEAEDPRHVVVMHFKPGQCEPTSIDHLKF